MTDIDELCKWWDHDNDLKIMEIQDHARQIRKQRNRERLSSQLKPCPFCGGKAAIFEYNQYAGGCHYTIARVLCSVCDARTTAVTDTRDMWQEEESMKKLVELWNRRVVE